MNLRRLALPQLAAVSLVALVGLGACSKPKAPAAKPPLQAVEAVRVRAPQGSAELSATGLLERRREMTLSFRIGGVMTALTVDEGDSVRAGQMLASLDPTSVAAADTRASVDVETARRELIRDQTLFDKGIISRQRLDDRLSAVKAAEAQASAAAFDRRWARLSAPASGVVLTRMAQVGEVVQPGQAVLRIADETSPLILRAPFPDRQVSRIKVGQSASIHIDGRPDAITGRVSRIGKSAGAQTGAVEVEIELPGLPGLRSGQVATAQIAVAAEAGSGASRVPAEAILEAKGLSAFVYVVDKGVARRRPVTFRGFDGDDALILGLGPDAQVITAGAGFISDGETVRVIDRSRLVAPAAQPASARP